MAGEPDCLLPRSSSDSRKDIFVGGDADISEAGEVRVVLVIPLSGVGGSAPFGAGRCGGGIDERCEERGRCPNLGATADPSVGTGDVLEPKL